MDRSKKTYISYNGVKPFLKENSYHNAYFAVTKGRFFRKCDAVFPLPKKCAENYPENRDFEIALCLESADSNCTAVSKGGKIQNTKLRIEHSTFFWAMEIIQ